MSDASGAVHPRSGIPLSQYVPNAAGDLIAVGPDAIADAIAYRKSLEQQLGGWDLRTLEERLRDIEERLRTLEEYATFPMRWVIGLDDDPRSDDSWPGR